MNEFKDVDAKIYPTYQCNANCPFCLTDIRPKLSEACTAEYLENFSKEIERYYRHGGRRVLFTGGEPTQAVEKLLGMLDIIRACSYKFDLIVLYTNGTRLLSEVEYQGERGTLLSLLAAKGLHAICLSTHSNIAEERLRLSPVVGALDVEALIRAILVSGVGLRLNATLQRGCVDSLSRVKQYVAWAASLGVTEVYFRDLFHVTNRGQRTTPGDQRKLAFTDEVRIDFDRLVGEVAGEKEFEFAASMKRHREWGTTHLCTHVSGCRVYFGTLEIGSEREDEVTYFAINPNGLMTPNMNAQEVPSR